MFGFGLLFLFCMVILFALLGTLVWGKKNPDGIFLACGNNEVQIGWSDNGETWTASTHAEGGLPFGTGGIAYNINKGNSMWVAEVILPETEPGNFFGQKMARYGMIVPGINLALLLGQVSEL